MQVSISPPLNQTDKYNQLAGWLSPSSSNLIRSVMSLNYTCPFSLPSSRNNISQKLHFRCKTPAPKAKKSLSVETGRKSTRMKDEEEGDGGQSDLLGRVEALIPVPVLITNSPLRGNSLHSLNEVPHSYDIDLDSTLQTFKFDLPPSSDTDLSLPPANIVIASPTGADHLDNHLDQNNFSNELREPELELYETSPKPSDAIDEEYDYVTVDSSVLALPSSFETSSFGDGGKEELAVIV